MELLAEDRNRIVEMAWEDRTPFEAIKAQFGLSEKDVIKVMRNEMTEKSFKMWRKRVTNRATKHLTKRGSDVDRFKCTRQRSISRNKISKR
ncbi:MAG: TIGR03643 family protein [Cytophagales bacterium]|nr:TIGR03643 family protein [Cytophagales bacterium]